MNPEKSLGRDVSKIPSPRINSFFGSEQVSIKKLFRGSIMAKTMSTTSSSYIITTIDLTTAFIGNIYNTKHRGLAIFGLLVWIFNIIISFAFDFYESHVKYGLAWAVVKGTEWLTFCLGTYFAIFKTIPWMKKGLDMLEKDGQYNRSLLRITASIKKLQLFLFIFTLTGSSVQYVILRLDKANHVAFDQSVSYGAEVLLHLLRFVSGLHVLYAYALFWYIASCVMEMTGHSMVEFQECISTRLRSKFHSPTLREAVTSFDERIKFVKTSSRSCLALLFLLLSLTLLSIMVNAYLYLYKNRYRIYIWHALMPLILAVYPLCTAAWVTKQYHWYFIVVVKAWAEYPEDSSDSDSDMETATDTQDKETITNRFKTKVAPSTDMRIHLPDKGHVSVGEPINTQNNAEILRKVFRGSIKAVGKWQRNRKIPSFRFEKYITYLNQVAPSSGFKIGVLTVTWERVSASLFLLISIVAVFIQETIFGDKKSQL
ncbi:uncharacterized protein LOC116308273 [Actinia tenebrosa]|uniref:Uncharacterized protein LOC116308273 n=1 Tax=Actinia tenebrosa TaxID=6105 RepID=A0A6P8J3D8_ACTTE|nr:uncharacterized protein LOC116308273 [Actinia tenebrosa]